MDIAYEAITVGQEGCSLLLQRCGVLHAMCVVRSTYRLLLAAHLHPIQDSNPNPNMRTREQGRLGPGDGQRYLGSALQSGAPDAPDPRFGEALYGHSMRVQSASPTMVSNAPGVSNGISNSFKGAKKSMVEPGTSQRPHTACTPAVERHLRRYTRCMSAGNYGQQRSPDVFSCAERPAGRFGSLSAAGELVARPGTPAPGFVSQGVIGAWGRHVGGVVNDGSERRPGRSKSTEPSLLGKLTSSLDNAADAADSMTSVVKSGVRTRIKAAVDCWWDEQRLGGCSSQRNTPSSGSLAGGAKRGSLQRSHSAGQRKTHAGSSKSGQAGDRLKGSSRSTHRPRSSSLTSQGSKSSSKGDKSHGSSNSSSIQEKSDSQADYEEQGGRSAAAQNRSGVSQSATSPSRAANSLMLISKLALPDTGTSYLGLGKYSLSSVLEAACSVAGEDKVGLEEVSSRSASPATPIQLADLSVASAKCAAHESKAGVENASGPELEQKTECQATGKMQAAGVQLGSSEAGGSRTQEITALQDITYKLSSDLGITREWFAEFCTELVYEWESDSEDDDVSDA